MADEVEVTAADMEAAGERIAARDGITVEQLRERLREVERTEAAERECELAGCARTFVPSNVRHRFCTPAHRAAAHRRVRTGGAS